MRASQGGFLPPRKRFSVDTLRLADKLHGHLRHGIGLREHGHGRLGEHLIAYEVGHFGGDIDIADAGFGVLQVFGLNGEVCHGIFKPVLHGAEIAADFGMPGLRVADAVQGGLGAFLRLYIHACQPEPCQSGIGRFDDVVILGGVVAGAKVNQNARRTACGLLRLAFRDCEGIKAGGIAEIGGIADDKLSLPAEIRIGNAADIRAVENDVQGLVFLYADFQRVGAGRRRRCRRFAR